MERGFSRNLSTLFGPHEHQGRRNQININVNFRGNAPPPKNSQPKNVSNMGEEAPQHKNVDVNFHIWGKMCFERKRGVVSVTPLTPLNPVLIIKRLTRPLSSSCFFFFLLTLNFLSYHHNYHGHNRHIHYHDHDFLHHRHTHCLPSQTCTAPLLTYNEMKCEIKAWTSSLFVALSSSSSYHNLFPVSISDGGRAFKLPKECLCSRFHLNHHHLDPLYHHELDLLGHIGDLDHELEHDELYVLDHDDLASLISLIMTIVILTIMKVISPLWSPVPGQECRCLTDAWKVKMEMWKAEFGLICCIMLKCC